MYIEYNSKRILSVLPHFSNERESPQEAWPAGEKNCLGFIEAVHQFI